MLSFLKEKLYSAKTYFFNIDKKSVLKNFFTILTIGLLLLTSGYSATEFSFSNRFVAILYLALFISSFCLFFAYLPYRKLDKNLFNLAFDKIKKPKVLCLIIFFTLFVVTVLLTCFKDGNFNGAIRLLLIVFSSILIAATVPFKKICRLFCLTIAFICVISLIIFLVAIVLGASGATSFFFTGNKSPVLSYGFFSFLLGGWNTYLTGDYLAYRLCGPFWEPSIFAAIIILGMIILLISDLRKKVPLFFIYLISLVLTFSTGGYVLFFFIPLIYLSIRINNKTARAITLATIGASVVLAIILVFGPFLDFFVEHVPTIFGKFRQGLFNNARFVSFRELMLIFTKSPIYGFGINGARLQYLAGLQGGTDASITSTTGMLIAAFGISGIIIAVGAFSLPVLIKSMRDSTILLIMLTLLVLTNLENMIMISGIVLFIICLNKEALFGEGCLQTSFADNPKLINSIMNRGETGTANKNMAGLLLIKGLSLVIGLFTIPVYNTFFITDEIYGVWSVIISVLTWTLLLDFGFGSGMRAKLADAIENNDDVLKKKIISSTYIGSIIASFLVFALLEILIFTIDLSALMGIPSSAVDPSVLKLSMSILSIGLCFEFVLKNISFINYAEKKTVLGASYALITNLLLILVFSIFKNGFESSKLIAASIIYALSVNVPFIIGTAIHFLKKTNRNTFPSIRGFEWSTCRSVMSFGILFFVIQIGFMLIARTDALFISHYFGPTSAGDYSKYYRIFSFFIGLMGAVVQQPIWSAIASSVNKGKPEGIKKYTIITLSISVVLFVFCFICGLGLQFIFDVWLGDNTIAVHWFISLSFIIYSLIFLLADALTIISNGLKLLLPQAIISMTMGIAKIIFLVLLPFMPSVQNLGWGIFIIIDAICYVPLLVVLPISITRKVKALKRAS